jgi:DNA-binding NarL/FixJ family response regulator
MTRLAGVRRSCGGTLTGQRRHASVVAYVSRLGHSSGAAEGIPRVAVEVAIVDPLPLFRDGAVMALAAAGHPVRTPADVLAWARQASAAVVLLTVQDENDWQLLDRLNENEPSHPVVVLLGTEAAAAGVRAVRAGARSVVPRQMTATMLRRTVAATIEGQAVLPAAVAAALAAGERASGGFGISAERLSWLQALATGSTVAELARDAGYSERAMFRLLRALYREMGVRSRIEALMRAREHGWM